MEELLQEKKYFCKHIAGLNYICKDITGFKY